MECDQNPPKCPTATTTRHKCAACFKQYKKKEHLIEHMKKSYHSVHQPKCGVCHKHCKSFESLREHIIGPLSKASCSRIFAERGCKFCLRIFDNLDSVSEHKQVCCLPAPVPFLKGPMNVASTKSEVCSSALSGNEAVAIDCEMVGGGSDGSLDLCARVCLIDENERIIFQSYVLPLSPVTNYRYEMTGIKDEHLRDAMPLHEVQDKIRQILYKEESDGVVGSNSGKSRILVGHNLACDLDCLRINYPDHLLRDTAKYQPLMKTNLVSHSLKYLTKTYLGYDIQMGVHDPYEDCVSAMRLYKRMRSQNHCIEGFPDTPVTEGFLTDVFNSWKAEEHEKMEPGELFKISRPNYRCWCLDSAQALQTMNTPTAWDIRSCSADDSRSLSHSIWGLRKGWPPRVES